MAQQSDSAQLTAQQLETWERFGPTYAELAISKDAAEPTSQQMIAAISRHKQVADGKSAYIASSSSVSVFVSKVLTCMFGLFGQETDFGPGVSLGSQFLDLASSAGEPATPLAKAFPHVQVVSTDLSPTSVQLAATHARASGLHNLRAEVADAQDLSAYADSTFAVVTCSFGLMFMPDFKRALHEMHRVLEQGGLVILTLLAEEARSENVQVRYQLCINSIAQ